MKLSNVQLRLLLPVVVKASRENPSVEWDDLVERLIVMAMHRGENKAVDALVESGGVTCHTPSPVVRAVHPLLGDAAWSTSAGDGSQVPAGMDDDSQEP